MAPDIDMMRVEEQNKALGHDGVQKKPQEHQDAAVNGQDGAQARNKNITDESVSPPPGQIQQSTGTNGQTGTEEQEKALTVDPEVANKGQVQQIIETHGQNGREKLIDTSGASAFHMDKPNPALFTNEKREIFMGPSPELNPGANDCIVRMRCNGICGSDVHFWHTGRIGPLIVDSDHVLGHEGAGTVVWTGANVKHLQAGDNVAVEPGVPCNNCYQCSTGNYNLCSDVAFSGVPPYSGSIRRYHVHPAAFLHKLPPGFSFSDGALLEPLSVVLHGFERAPIKLGEGTVICGAGPIGMCALAVAKASGAAPILVTDLDAGRLKFAKEFVPNCLTFQIDPKKGYQETADEILATIREGGGEQPRVVYECTGVQSSVVTACYLPRPAGEVMVIGVGKPMMNEIPFMHISLAEVDLKFINRYHHSWPSAIRLLQHKVIDLQPLVTHRFSLEEANKALEASADRNSGSIKIHIEDHEP